MLPLLKTYERRTLGKHDTQLRRAKASAKAVKAQQGLERVSYRVEADDILILNGPYRNRRVRELFASGSVERDYVVRHLWFTGDQEVVRIINSMVCR